LLSNIQNNTLIKANPSISINQNDFHILYENHATWIKLFHPIKIDNVYFRYHLIRYIFIKWIGTCTSFIHEFKNEKYKDNIGFKDIFLVENINLRQKYGKQCHIQQIISLVKLIRKCGLNFDKRIFLFYELKNIANEKNTASRTSFYFYQLCLKNAHRIQIGSFPLDGYIYNIAHDIFYYNSFDLSKFIL